MENRCPLTYILILGAVLQVCPPSFNFRETLSWHNLISSWEGGWREQRSVHCSGEGGTTVQRSGQHCPLKSPQAGLLRLPIPNPVRKWKEAHTINGYSPPVKTVGIQGHLETLLYPCLHFKMTKWVCTSFQSGEPSLDPVYMKRSQAPGLYRPQIFEPPWPAPTQNCTPSSSQDSTGS